MGGDQKSQNTLNPYSLQKHSPLNRTSQVEFPPTFV